MVEEVRRIPGWCVLLCTCDKTFWRPGTLRPWWGNPGCWAASIRGSSRRRIEHLRPSRARTISRWVSWDWGNAPLGAEGLDRWCRTCRDPGPSAWSRCGPGLLKSRRWRLRSLAGSDSATCNSGVQSAWFRRRISGRIWLPTSISNWGPNGPVRTSQSPSLARSPICSARATLCSSWPNTWLPNLLFCK